MHDQRASRARYLAVLVALVLSVAYSPAWSHCDALDGPVVTDAKVALEAEDVTGVLKWIPEKDEREVKEAFKQTLVVRKHGAEAQALADRYFFETLVRLHREYEGASFTGLKPAGGSVHPAVARVDEALENGKGDALAKAVGHAVESSIQKQFSETLNARSAQDESVQAGREFVDRYVELVHYVKYLHEAVSGNHDHGH